MALVIAWLNGYVHIVKLKLKYLLHDQTYAISLCFLFLFFAIWFVVIFYLLLVLRRNKTWGGGISKGERIYHPSFIPNKSVSGWLPGRHPCLRNRIRDSKEPDGTRLPLFSLVYLLRLGAPLPMQLTWHIFLPAAALVNYSRWLLVKVLSFPFCFFLAAQGVCFASFSKGKGCDVAKVGSDGGCKV